MHDTEQFEALSFGKVNSYLQLFHHSNYNDIVIEMIDEAHKKHVPIISYNVASLLHSLMLIHQPKNILEFGTAYGFSTFIMRDNALPDTHIVTIDISEERQIVARNFFKKLHYFDERISFINDDFRNPELIDHLSKEYSPFDLVFIDAAKAQYSILLKMLSKILSDNAIIILDNVLLNGWIIAGKYPNHRQKTMFKRMNAFLEEIQNSTEYHATLFPFDDGVLLLTKNRR